MREGADAPLVEVLGKDGDQRVRRPAARAPVTCITEAINRPVYPGSHKMNSESRQDSRVPTAELNDDELAKVVGGV